MQGRQNVWGYRDRSVFTRQINPILIRVGVDYSHPLCNLLPTKVFDVSTPILAARTVLYMSQLALLDFMFTRSTGILFFFFIIMKRNKPKYYSHFVKKLAKVEQKKRLYIVYVAQ